MRMYTLASLSESKQICPLETELYAILILIGTFLTSMFVQSGLTCTLGVRFLTVSSASGKGALGTIGICF